MTNKVIRFANVPVNATFSPANGEIGSTSVFIKRVNGICPQLGARDGKGNQVESIFWPNDRVVLHALPKRKV